MTARTIKACDEDLDQVLYDLDGHLHLLSLAEHQEKRIHAENGSLKDFALAQARAANIRSQIGYGARKLGLSSQTVRILGETHEVLKKRMGRRPNIEQLHNALEVVAHLNVCAASAKEAARVEAEAAAKEADILARASTAALEHLRKIA
jgi:hypothetical protein